jgi:multidrug resistance efflux pump
MDPSSAPRPEVTTVSSLEAHVLPHVVEIASSSAGVVTRMFVRERDVVSRGDALLEIAGGVTWDSGVILRSSVPGVVSRCRIRVGDAVAPSTRILSIARADDVLVVARFAPTAGLPLRDWRRASVRIPRAAGQPLGAAIVCVSGASGADTAGSTALHGSASVRVVARLQSAPPAAMWPGVEAILDVECEAAGAGRANGATVRGTAP